ncbi:MAG: hypothetical protein Q8N65_00845, partial [bacterium]|nr:hypothetical protein [bacterium]
MTLSRQKKDFFSFPLLTVGILTLLFILLFIPAEKTLAGCSNWYGSGGCNPNYCGRTDGCDYNMDSWCCWNNAGRNCDCNEECPDDYWAGEYQCSGNTRQQKWVDMYCSPSWATWCNTSAAYCNYSTSWGNNVDCGGDYWENSYSCSGNMQKRWYVHRGCSSGSCYNWGSWENWSDCGGDYWADSYTCSGTMQKRLYVHRGCSSNSCYNWSSWENWSECNSDYWDNSYRCSGTMRQRWYVSRGCSGSSCYNNGSWQNWTECGSDYWENTYRCSASKQLERYYHSRGCTSNNCYDNTSWQWQKDCSYASGWYDYYRCSGNTKQRQYWYRDGCSGSDCYTKTDNWADSENCGQNKYCAGSQPNSYCQTCSAGWGNCDQSVGNGCEINLTNNNSNCGTCGNVCGSGYGCVSSSCQDTNPPSFSSFYVSPTSWTKNDPTWYWAASDAASGMRTNNRYYIFLNGAGQYYTNNTSYQPSLGTGSHRVSVNAYDNANNAVG